MLERRSLRAPITLGVVLIVSIVILAAVWVSGGLIGMSDRSSRPVFWAIIATGGILLSVVLAGVIAYLTLTVKAFRLNQRQSNFIDSVTHELKSPIASLKLYLQTMAQREVGEAQKRDFHRFMLEDVERLDSLINHLLDAARIDQNAKPANNESIRLDQLLCQCAQAACLRYRLPPETVRVETPEITIVSTPVEVEILFRNLIDNAVKYGGSPPQVIVSASLTGQDQVTVLISDNGPGIPTDQRRKVFGRFVRLGNELERCTPGTGLGLYLVRNVAKSLGGTIRIRDCGTKLRGVSTPATTTIDGEALTGTEFEVTLPGAVPQLAVGENLVPLGALSPR